MTPSPEHLEVLLPPRLLLPPVVHPLAEFQLPCLVALGMEAQPDMKWPNTRVHENEQMREAAGKASLEEALRTSLGGMAKPLSIKTPSAPHPGTPPAQQCRWLGQEHFSARGASQTEGAQRQPPQESDSGLAASWVLCQLTSPALLARTSEPHTGAAVFLTPLASAS